MTASKEVKGSGDADLVSRLRAESGGFGIVSLNFYPFGAWLLQKKSLGEAQACSRLSGVFRRASR